MFVFAFSKTGGHIYPAVALSQEYSGPSIFLGPKHSEVLAIMQRYDCRFFPYLSSGKNLISWGISFIKVFCFLLMRRPNKVIGTGGSSMIPVVLAAYLLRIPVVLLEQNVLPGRATRFASIFATRLYSSFSDSSRYIKSPKLKCLGNPVRRYFADDEPGRVLKRYQLADKNCVLLLGGSQGARVFAEELPQIFEKLKKSGKDEYPPIPKIIVGLLNNKNTKDLIIEKIIVNKENKDFIIFPFKKGDDGIFIK